MNTGEQGQWLVPRHPKADTRPIGFFDCETHGLGGDFLLGASQIEGEPDAVLAHSVDDLWDRILEPETPVRCWYAHNAGGYDLKYLLTGERFEALLSEGWECSVVTSGQQHVLGVKMSAPPTEAHRKRFRVQIRDSLKLTGVSLEESCKALGVPGKLGGGIDWDTETFDPANPFHVLYLKQDVTAGLGMVRALSDLIWEHFQVPIGWTLPATGLAALQATLSRPYHRASRRTQNYARRAYIGGLVYPGYAEVHDAQKFDRNSAYPSVMRGMLPCGRGTYTDRWIDGCPGFYEVYCEVPADSAWTVLPLRTNTGVIFPTGNFRTTCSSVEIELARSLGAIVEVVGGVYFPYSETVCAEFVARCEALRMQDPWGPIGWIAKLLQNSVYGKFGARETHSAFVISDVPPACEGVALVSRSDQDVRVWEYQEQSDEGYMHVEWAAWITAVQRCELHRIAIMVGPDNIAYMDTDSVTITQGAEMPPELIGVKYGEWKHEAKISHQVTAAPKAYAWVGDKWDSRKGVWKDGGESACKGVSKKLLTFDDLARAARGERVRKDMRISTNLIVMLKTGGDRMQDITRTLATPESCQGWRLREDGRFIPVNLDQTA